MNSTIVVDASVILKWAFPPGTEADQERALTIVEAINLGKVDVYVPSLWLFEVGNLLARKYPTEARAHLTDLFALLGPGESHEDPAWLDATLNLTTRYPVTFYDASYHALAIVQQGTFITADEKYLAAAGEAGHILHLKDFR